MKNLRYYPALLMLLVACVAAAQQRRVHGLVVDSLTRQPIPYVAVWLEGTDRGAMTDERGRFSIDTELAHRGVSTSVMGYRRKTLPATRLGVYVVEMVPEGVELGEVTVRPGREHYSKRNNPAVDLQRRIRNMRRDNDPRRNPYYSYEKYERMSLALNDFSTSADSNALLRTYPELAGHIDTSALSGRPILTLAMREKASMVAHRATPESTREVVHAQRREGVDEILDPEATQRLYEDILREPDLYADNITLMQNRLVSPLSRLGPDVYKYYLGDTVVIGTLPCVTLTFVPHNTAVPGFVGRMYVAVGDTTMFVRRVEMNVPSSANLNFVNALRIVQEFERAPDGSRLKLLDDMVIEAGLTGRASQFYVRRVTATRAHSFEAPDDEAIFSLEAPVTVESEANLRDSLYWEHTRQVAIAHGEDRLEDMQQVLRSRWLYRVGEKALRLATSGYVPLGRPSRFDLGNIFTFVSRNSLEGWRLKVGGISTAALSPHMFVRPYVAYGLHDRRWKYGTELEYSFRRKERHSREFPMHALRVSHSYDTERLGQGALSGAGDITTAISRSGNSLTVYRRLTELKYVLETQQHLALTASVFTRRREATSAVAFVDGRGERFPHLTTTGATLTLRWAPGETFYQTRTRRLPVNLDAPVFTLTHTYAPAHRLGNRDGGVNATEASVSYRAWLSAWGMVDLSAKGGHLWSRSSWPSLLIPATNLSYFIAPDAFQLLNPLEFVFDSYVLWDVTYQANGALLNYIPLVKRLKLREVVGFRGVWGRLSAKNDPAQHPELLQFPADAMCRRMTSHPYMEVSAGLDNILRLLRVEYYWRLTYREPGMPRAGVRFSIRFSF